MEYFRPTVPEHANLPSHLPTRVFAPESRICDVRHRVHTRAAPSRCLCLRVFTGKREGVQAPRGLEARGWSHYRHKATIRLPSGLGLPLFACLSFSLSPSLSNPLWLPFSLSLSLSLRARARAYSLPHSLRSYSWFKFNCLLSAIPGSESLMMESPRSEAAASLSAPSFILRPPPSLSRRFSAPRERPLSLNFRMERRLHVVACAIIFANSAFLILLTCNRFYVHILFLYP